jgi:hypothetical protein
MFRFLHRSIHKPTKIHFPDQILYENKDKTIVYASYFLIGSTSLFLYSLTKSYEYDPDMAAMAVATAASISIPLGAYYYGRHRIVKVELLKNGTVVRLTNSLPFRNIDYYEKQWFYTRERSELGQLTLHFENRRFILSGGEFSPNFNTIFKKK